MLPVTLGLLDLTETIDIHWQTFKLLLIDKLGIKLHTERLCLEGAERKFTLDELKQHDGRDGRPAYFAYKGKVYDVTESYLWISGDHQGQHEAGRDITSEMAFAPHGEEMLERVKLIGTLVPSDKKE